MNGLSKIAGIFFMTAAFAGNANASDNLWIGAKVGTLGIGLEATWAPLPWLDLRVGADRYDYGNTGAQAGINYDADLSLDTYHATANFRFPLSPMRITAGAFVNNNELDMSSLPAPIYDIGGTLYTGADVGTLRSVTYFEGTSPYVGVGFDFELFNKIGLNLDFGVLLQGDPVVTLSSNGLLADDDVFLVALENERQQLEAEVEDYKAWPVISVGLTFNFF
jgi:hypothetical protein